MIKMAWGFQNSWQRHLCRDKVPPVLLDGGFFLTAVKIVLCGRIVILLQHLFVSEFCYPVGFSTLNYVIVHKTVLKYWQVHCTLVLEPDHTDHLACLFIYLFIYFLHNFVYSWEQGSTHFKRILVDQCGYSTSVDTVVKKVYVTSWF